MYRVRTQHTVNTAALRDDCGKRNKQPVWKYMKNNGKQGAASVGLPVFGGDVTRAGVVTVRQKESPWGFAPPLAYFEGQCYELDGGMDGKDDEKGQHWIHVTIHKARHLEKFKLAPGTAPGAPTPKALFVRYKDSLVERVDNGAGYQMEVNIIALLSSPSLPLPLFLSVCPQL